MRENRLRWLGHLLWRLAVRYWKVEILMSYWVRCEPKHTWPDSG